MAPKLNKKFKLSMPHSYIVLIMITIVVGALTFIIPAGSFERVIDPELGREIVVAESFKFEGTNPTTIWEFMQSFYKGMINASDIIVFVLFAASYVGLLIRIGAIDALVGMILRKLGKRDYLLIPVFTVFFGILGSTFGIMEEVYGLVPAFIMIAVSLGYDKVVGGAIVCTGITAGFAAATLNPFTIGIASAIADVPLVTAKVLGFRIFAFVVFMSVVTFWIMRYAKRVRKDPTRSYVYGTEDAVTIDQNSLTKEDLMDINFTIQQKVSLLGLVVLMGIIGYSVVALGFYLQELATIFLIGMILTGLYNKMSASDIADSFVESSKEVLFGAIIIGLSRAIPVIMEDAGIIDTVVYYISNLISGLPTQLAAIGMLFAQNFINFFIPSGSGQAVITMPIMAPIADVIGMSRQTAVLAYQFGDGFSKLFWPIGVAFDCGFIGISMGRWYKFIAPLFGILVIFQILLLILAVAIGI